VVDASRILAGPYLAMLLGDLGADVVKIERPGDGDPTRSWGPPWVGTQARRTSSYFVAANRNKRSLALDLKQAAGREVFARLLERADVLIENFLPRDWRSLGFSAEGGAAALARRHPSLVRCTITGYGARGPQADRPAYDLALQAESGLMAVTGFATGEPVRVGVAIVDFLAALYGVTGLLAALLARERDRSSGRESDGAAGRAPAGRAVEVTMTGAATAFLSYAAQAWLADGREVPRLGSAHPNLVPYRAFAARDGWFVVGVGSEAQWRRFCGAIGLPRLAESPHYRDNAARISHRTTLERRLARHFSTAPIDSWLERLGAARVPSAPVAPLSRAMQQAVVEGRIPAMPAGAFGTLRTVAAPFLFDGKRPEVARSAPALGEHSREVLRECGYSAREVARFIEQGVAGSPTLPATARRKR
jgi:crotonobetainyl-CoA:carnitine CoA-transferase CaiB-like acyl-CoA transferase